MASRVPRGSQRTKPYVYRPFETDHEIRLFYMHPGRCDDPVKGRLVHISFAKKSEYEALSYTWGDATILHELDTDEGVIRITDSLRCALARLRFPGQSRVLWVDALYINQAENKEKSQQILLMPKIYSSVSKAVVYLGEKEDRSDLAINLIEKIAKPISVLSQLKSWRRLP